MHNSPVCTHHDPRQAPSNSHCKIVHVPAITCSTHRAAKCIGCTSNKQRRLIYSPCGHGIPPAKSTIFSTQSTKHHHVSTENRYKLRPTRVEHGLIDRIPHHQPRAHPVQKRHDRPPTVMLRNATMQEAPRLPVQARAEPH